MVSFWVKLPCGQARSLVEVTIDTIKLYTVERAVFLAVIQNSAKFKTSEFWFS